MTSPHPELDDRADAVVITRLPWPLRLARWWSVRGPHRGRWRVWELAANLSGRGRLYRTRLNCGLEVLVDLGDPMSRYPIAYGGMPEPALEKTVRALLAPGHTFIDIGSNFGYYALLAATLVGPTGAVHAFEPQPQVAALLRRNARELALHHLTVHRLALGDCAGTLILHVPRGGQSGLATARADAPWCTRHRALPLEVPLARLDDLYHAGAIGCPTAVKIDAEGYELPIVRGALTLLQRCRPVVFFEAGADAEDPRPLFSDLGYAVFRLTDAGLLPLRPDEPLRQQHNLCALDPDHHDLAEVTR